MRLKFYYSTFSFFLLFCQGLLAQRSADFTFDQSVQNDTLYLDFKVKRTSPATFDLGGYNIVFKVDTTVVDTSNAKLFSQGFFGVKTTEYGPVRFIYLSASTYQLTLYKNLSSSATSALPDAFVSAGKVGFKIKGCGPSNVIFTSPPFTTIVAWNGSAAIVSETAITPASIPLSGKSHAKLIVSKDSVCKNGSVTFTSELKPSFSNYTLFSRSNTGVNTLLSGPQASNIFPNVTILADNQFFVRFQNGTNVSCSDNTDSIKVVAIDPQPGLTITPPAPPVCLGNILTISSSSNNVNNGFSWKLNPATLAQFVGASSGVGKNSVVVDFDGINPYSVQLSVQDTNKFGCVSPVSVITINAVKCDLSPDFTINGSDVGVSSCQNTFVTFKDKSVSSAGTIAKWSWQFGAGATPDTSNLKDPLPVMYSSAGIVNVKLTVTDNNGLSKSIVKSPTVRVLSVLSATPNPSCGSSSCNEVNFNWQPIAEVTSYEVKYKKGLKGTFTAFQNISLATSFKVTAASPGIGGSLDFSDTKNDTVYFQVRAIAGTCDTTVSVIVFCRPSYCSIPPECQLPKVVVTGPPSACLGSNIQINVTSDPVDFYDVSGSRQVRFVWDNGSFTTSHSYNVNVNTPDFQKVTLLVVDTLKAQCYFLNTLSIPVGKVLITKPDLGIQDLECDRATFVWKHVVGAQKYQIKYSGTCIGTQDWTDAPLNGQAEFFEVNGLTNGCNINFQVRAVGSCNSTESDTLISPPTCSCFIGHIASSNVRSCALDTIDLKISNIQSPNWEITWFDPVKNISVSSKTDSVYRFVPDLPDKLYVINYSIVDLTKPGGCKTSDKIRDTTSSPKSALWNPGKETFCISDVSYYLNNKTDDAGFAFYGTGIKKVNNSYYFNASTAGIGNHTITYNACGNRESHTLRVVDKPCVTTVVDGQNLINDPNDLYTACDGTIYISDNTSIWKYLANSIDGIPELITKSPVAGDRSGSIAAARFNKPKGLALDESTGNELYFADNGNNRIKKIVFDKLRIDSVAGTNVPFDIPNNSSPVSTLDKARFYAPYGLAMHPNSDTLYVSDENRNNIKSFTFKGPSQQIKLAVGNRLSGTALPGRGKAVNIRPRRIAVDSNGLSFTDNNNFVGRYQFSTDIASAMTTDNGIGYSDGFSNQYKVNRVSGITPRIGDWIYFTDEFNFSLRRVNVITGYMETVAGSPPPNIINDIADGPALEARFNQPIALSFNIKGYIDVLDKGVAGTYVRRFYIPKWGVGTWDGFDSTYVVKCDSDTLSPIYSAGILRQVSGKSNALFSKTIFNPKDTGNYLLSYTIKVGRCDTTFYKNVYVREQPKPTLRDDTTCSPAALLSATAIRDTTVRYKWFGPDVRTLPLAGVTSDTNRTVSVAITGKYWVEIYFGKKRGCFVTDSASIKIIKGQIGKINSTPAESPANVVTLCYGGTAKLSMDEVSSTAPKFKSFLWSTGDTSRAITASGSAVYTVVAQDLLGCDVAARFKVLQQAVPGICIKATDVTSGKSLGWGSYTVSTFAGKPGVSGAANGKGSLATFKAPWGLTIYKDTLYVSDKNNKIRSVSLNDANVKDFLGTGSNTIIDSVGKNLAALNTPQGFRFDKFGNLYVANTGANNIAKYDLAKNLYYILAGSGTAFYADSIGKFADLNQPYDLEVDPAGNVIFTDNQNHAIRTIDSKRRVRTLAGNPPNLGSTDGKGRSASFNWPWGITSTPSGDLFIAEDANHTLRKLALDSSVKLVAGGFNNIGNNSNITGTSVPGVNARFNRPWNLTSDQSGNVFITDAGNNLLRLLDTKGNVITIAGKQGITGNKDGSIDSATFSNITGVVVDPKTQSVYVADQNNNTIRKLTKNKTVYFCKGNLYSLADSCTNARTDLTVTWKKKASNGTFVTQFSGAPTNQADTATFVMEVRYKGNTCPEVITDTIKVRYHEPDTTFRIPQPVGLGGLIEICQGDSLLLTATPGYSEYRWGMKQSSVETDLGTSTTNTFKTAFGTAPVFARLFVSVRNNKTGCIDRLRNINERSLYVRESLKANFKDSLKCLGNLTRFEPLDSDQLVNTYKWNFGDLTTVNDSSNFPVGEYEYPLSGTYNVTMIVTDPSQNTCPDTITKPVTISSLPKLSLNINGLSDSIRFCGTTSQSINLQANFTPDVNTVAPYNFYWSQTNTPGGLTAPVTSVPANTAAPVLAAGDYSSLFGYSVFVKDSKNCASNKDTVFARLSRNPDFTISASKTKICLGLSTVLSATDVTIPMGKPTDYSYKWFLAGVRINTDTFSTASSISVTPLISGSYTLIVKNLVTGCSGTFTSPMIEVIGFKIVIDSVPAPPFCSDPTNVQLKAQVASGNPAGTLIISWTDKTTGKAPSTISSNSVLEPSILNDSTRILKIYVEDNVGCFSTDSVKVRGTSSKKPDFGIQLTPGSPICRGKIMTFTPVDSATVPVPSFNYTYEWDSAGVKLNNDINTPVLNSRTFRSGIYSVKITDKNTNCGSTFDTSIVVKGFDLSIQQLVTPACTPTIWRQLTPAFDGDTVSPLQVKWTDSTGSPARSIDNPDILRASIFNDSTRSYKLFVKDDLGCFDSAYVTVKGSSVVRPDFGLLPIADDSICRGVQVTLTPVDNSSSPVNQFNYFWDSLGVQVNPNINNPVLIKTPRQSVEYKLRVVSRNSGCTDTVAAPRINVSGFTVVIDSVTQPKLCDDPGITLKSNVTGDTLSPTTRLWTDASTGKTSASIADPTRLTVFAINDSTRTYKFTVRDAAGCEDFSFIKVKGTSKLKPWFFINMSDPGPICRGEQVVFTPVDLRNNPQRPGDYTYAWDSANVNIIPNSLNNPVLVRSPKNTVQYSLKIISKQNGCDTVFKANNLVVNGFDVTLKLVDALIPCQASDSARIQSTITANQITGIQWTDKSTGQVPATLYNPLSQNVKVFRDITRYYKLTVKDNIGCESSDSINVRANSLTPPEFAVASSRDTGVCVGSSVPVRLIVTKGVAPYKFVWRDAAGNIASEVNQADNLYPVFSATGSAQKKYYVTMQDADECFTAGPDSVSITLYDMNISIEGTTNILCRSILDPAPLTDYKLIIIPPNPGLSIPTWTNLTTGKVVTQGPFLGNITEPGRYQVELVNYTTSCVRSRTVDIALLNKPESSKLNIVPDDSCNSTPIQLFASFNNPNVKSGADSIIYSWKVINGLNKFASKDSNAIYLPAVADTNSITFKVYTSNRCGSDSAEVSSAKLVPGPKAKILASTLETSINKDVIFTNGTVNSDSVNLLTVESGFNTTWGAGNGQSVTQVYFSEGKFKTKLWSINKNGCESSDSVTVVVITNKQNIFIPNVFSPNASQEENKTFRIFGQNLSPNDFNMIVYNRWGHVVFVTTDLNKAMFVGWDGKDGGAESQMGVYTYAIKAKYLEGNDFEKTGTVTLLR